MSFFISIFNLILYQPLFNVLVLLYQYLPGHDFGIAVIVLTILIKIILYPLGARGVKSQRTLSDLQPKIKEIQERFKNDKEKQARETMELYKKEKINPFSGCLPLLVQLPILIALYRVFWRGFSQNQLSFLYSFVPNPGQIDTTFLGMTDLTQSAVAKVNGVSHLVWLNIAIIIGAGIAQFFQTKMLTPKQKLAKKDPSDFSQAMQKQMIYFFPIFTVFILWRLPAAVALYWLVVSLFSIVQQYFIFKHSRYAQPR